ncbi:zinc finger and BTB domain-containing protein 12-like, partial [Conger conger]|uniref:zinc finger and BTB domain-containing protein 12-like n=1 Tax=Conger conger TaxID=82655 RepID=UPI002A5A845F
MEVLCFRLPGHGDATLRNMNCLRSRQHFCDVTIVASDRQTFRGHKVVLAACSPFLRDQFLLNPSSELKVSVLHSSRVVCELLQSCYTGILQFSPKEIINYLTAASYLQMEHVVEKCRGALSQYLQPRTPSPPGTIKSEESEPLLAFDSGDQHPVRSRSPPGGKGSSLQPHRNSADRQSDVHKDPNAAQDIPEFRVRSAGPSGEFQEEEEEEREDLEVFQVCIEDEEEGIEEKREGEGEEGEYGSRGEVVVALDGNQGNGDEGHFGAPAAAGREGYRMFRRRPWEMARGRGRGFPGRRRGNRERRLVGAPPAEEWRIPTPEEIMGSFGLVHPDFGQEGGGPAVPGGYELPQAEADRALRAGYGMGEGQGGDFGLGEGSGAGGEGEESESVAVVGSTSCGVVSCEHCGLAFPSAESLALHASSAHQALLFVCPRCGKHFSHAYHLNRHMSTHRGGRCHRCPLCHKTFTQKSTLCDHMNLHSGERPHRCSYCHVRFAHKPALRRHLKEQHAKTTAQNCLEAQREREREADGE